MLITPTGTYPCIVAHYQSNRPDGFMETVIVAATGVKPPNGYSHSPIGNLTGLDSSGAPINNNLMFTNFTVTVQHWVCSDCSIVPAIDGLASEAELKFVDLSGGTSYLRK